MQTMIDNMNASGEFLIEVIRDGKHGPQVVQSVRAKNLIVNTGKRQIWRMCSAALSTKKFNFIRIGTSPAAATSGSTNVKSPVSATLKTCTTVSLLAGTRTVQFMYSYASGGGSISATNIREVCILNQITSPGGSALCRAVFTAVTKTTADKLKITYSARIT